MKTWTARIRQLRISHQLLLSYLLLCTVPMAITTYIFYTQAKSQAESSFSQYGSLLASHANESIHMFMSIIDNTSKTLFTDTEIMNYLGAEDRYTSYESTTLQTAISVKLNHYVIQMPFLYGVTIISHNGIMYDSEFRNDPFAQPIQLAPRWQERIIQANGKLVMTPAHSKTLPIPDDPDSLFSVGRVLTTNEGRQAGIALFHLHAGTLLSQVDSGGNELDHVRIKLTTWDDQLIHDTAYLSADVAGSAPPPFDEKLYVIYTNNRMDAGMKVTVGVFKSDLYESIHFYRKLFYGLLAGNLTLILIASILFSRGITKPVSQLIQSMKRLRTGNYEPLRPERASREIRQLTGTYNMMLARMKHLIEDVYLATIQHKEARLTALQSQINPHWLYNTLESIRMKAMIAGNRDIAAMIRTLGRLLKTALADEDTPHCLADEIRYVASYMELQNIRYRDRFLLDVNVSDAMLEMGMLKLSLQPIVENCIIHGFLDHDRSYRIRISGSLDDSWFIVTVADDGAGMTEERLGQTLRMLRQPEKHGGRTHRLTTREREAPDASLGLRNVQERLLLHYGRRAGLDIQSDAGQGTVVTLRIPLSSMKEVQADV